MSTKKLARTVIEPGRANFTKVERKDENRCDRRASRLLSHAVLRDPERLERAHFPRRRPVHVVQKDKLSPLERWLRKQKDRPWGDVYSEIKARCDVRTTPGRHILYDHLLRSIVGNGITPETPWSWRNEFHVDDEGILRYVPPPARRHYEPLWGSPASREIADFVKSRRVRVYGVALFWMVRVNACARCGPDCVDHLRFRQDARLDQDEVETWLAFGEGFRDRHTWKDPKAGIE